MGTKSIDERAQIILDGIKYRAGKRFRQGNLQNPYGDPSDIEDAILMGMSQIYEREIDSLKRQEHYDALWVCPHCGKSTRR